VETIFGEREADKTFKQIDWSSVDDKMVMLCTSTIIGQVRESHLRTRVVFIFSRPDFANTCTICETTTSAPIEVELDWNFEHCSTIWNTRGKQSSKTLFKVKPTKTHKIYEPTSTL
jgi:hypothetical protein